MKKKYFSDSCNRGIGKAILQTFNATKFNLIGLGRKENKFLVSTIQ